MSMQKYRSDISTVQSDGSIAHFSCCQGGKQLAKVVNCRLENLHGDMRATVYVVGEADSFFSIPAACKLFGKRVSGYITGDDNGRMVFRHTYY